MEVRFNTCSWLAVLSLFLLLGSGHAKAVDTILLLKAEDAFLADVARGIEEELESVLDVHTVAIKQDASARVIGDILISKQPKLVVLLGNTAIRTYIDYQQDHPNKNFPPALLAAALYIDQLVAQIKNSTGIRYEVPAVTSAVNLREVMNTPVKKIGVIHRDWLTGFIALNAKYCKIEGFELIPMRIPNKSQNFEGLVSRSIKALSPKVDAFWIVNDNALMTGSILTSAWIPKLTRARKPVIVGVEALVETKLRFGTLSVSPDHYALGVQVAGKILDIHDLQWRVKDMEVDQPLSVTKVLNLNISNERKLKINKGKLGDIDRIITE